MRKHFVWVSDDARRAAIDAAVCSVVAALPEYALARLESGYRRWGLHAVISAGKASEAADEGRGSTRGCRRRLVAKV